MEYTLTSFTLPDGSAITFDHFEFCAAFTLAGVPQDDEAEATRKTAEVVAQVIPALKDRSVPFRAGIGFRINAWLQSLGKDTGQ